MTFHDWIFSIYPPNAAINGRYGALHITTIILCVCAIALIACLRNRNEKSRSRIIQLLAAGIFVLEVARRIINLSRGEISDLSGMAYVLIPRPWCAISCWLTMYTALRRKTWLYNFSAMNSLLCALVFFAYPSVGFNHNVILFENFYSIATHSLLLVCSVSMMTLGLTNFRYDSREVRNCLVLLAGVFLYAAAEILLGIEPDPLYFMPGSEVQDFLGVSYPVFLVIYVTFLSLYFNAFYLLQKHLPHLKKSPVVSAQ